MTVSSPSPPRADVPSQQEVMQQAGAENFPVASRLLGRRERSQLLTIYGFARLVDDLGDEMADDRLAHLERLEHDLDAIYAGRRPEHPVMRSIAPTIARCRLPDAPFRRLIEANRRDQVVASYQTFDELVDYCRLSATPVGELVLHVFGAATPERIERSDDICIALQVVEHLQDIGEDYARGRVYMPQQDMAAVGCREADLGVSSMSAPLRELLSLEAARARRLLDSGAPLIRTLGLRPRLAVAGFVAGGRAALDALERARYDVLSEQPRPGTRDFAIRWLGAVGGR